MTAVELGANIGELLAVVLGVAVALVTLGLAMWAFVRVWRDRGDR